MLTIAISFYLNPLNLGIDLKMTIFKVSLSQAPVSICILQGPCRIALSNALVEYHGDSTAETRHCDLKKQALRL